MIFKLLIDSVFAGFIGYEREKEKRPAGFRTHILVAMGSAIFTMISISAFASPADPGRMASSIVVGIGFLGAGTIIQLKNKVVGLTTAASLWLTAAIGITVGVGWYLLAFTSTILGFIVLGMKSVENTIANSSKSKRRDRKKR